MITYTTTYKGQTFTFISRKMAQAFVTKGYTVNVYKNGKKIYTMCPIDNKGQK